MYSCTSQSAREMGGCGCSKKEVGCTVFGASMIAFIAVSYPVLNAIINNKIIQTVLLLNGTELYNMWEEPTVPIYMQFYVFDLKNPMEVLQGAKPFLDQRGPYTYREYRKKVDITQNNNGTVSYRQIKQYFFQPDMSVGEDTDTVMTVNIPLLGFAESLRYESPTMKMAESFLLQLFKMELFNKRSIADIIFGYQDPLLDFGKRYFPDWFYTSTVGILAGKNNTDDGVYTVYTGEKDISHLGVIDKYNGSDHIHFWSTQYANMVNGSDGSVCPPHIDKTKPLYMFSTDICRSVYGVYNRTVQTKHGVPAYHFSCPEDVLANASVVPDNIGFCTPHSQCMDKGVINITTCQTVDHFPIPLIVSFPHFYLAAEQYLDAILGLQPDPAQHSTVVEVEPNTGLVMQIAKRLQINIYIDKSAKISQLHDVTSMVYPILWLNESAAIDDSHAQELYSQLILPMRIAWIIQLLGLLLGGAILLIALTSMTHSCHRKNVQEMQDITSREQDETSPLLDS